MTVGLDSMHEPEKDTPRSDNRWKKESVINKGEENGDKLFQEQEIDHLMKKKTIILKGKAHDENKMKCYRIISQVKKPQNKREKGDGKYTNYILEEVLHGLIYM